MKKNDVFTFTAPNGVKVTAVCLKTLNSTMHQITYLCYAQNRLFTMIAKEDVNFDNGHVDWITIYGEVIVEYCILPEYDDILQDYQRDIDMEQISAHQSWEEEFERDLQGCCDDKYKITLF